jgi:lipopolysaccharide export system protein LptC
MNGRLFDRLAALGSLALLFLLACLTYYLAEVANKTSTVVEKAKPTEADFYVSGFSFIRLNSQGQPAFKIVAKKMIHYPDRDTSEFEEPVATGLRDNGSLVTISAQRGVSRDIQTSDPGILNLSGNVVLRLKGTDGRPDSVVTTESLVVNPDAETASSEELVRFTNGSSTLSGTGFTFDNTTRQMSLLSKVQGRMQGQEPVSPR